MASKGLARWQHGQLRLPEIRIGLTAKMAVFLVFGTVTLIGFFAYFGTTALGENTQRTLQERVVLAQMAASYIDAQLENIETVLAYTATEGDWADPARTEAALERAYRLRLGFFASRVFVVDQSGAVIAARPRITTTLNLENVASVAAVLGGASFAVSHLPQPVGQSESGILAATPIRDKDGKVERAIVLNLDFSSPHLHSFSHPVGLGESGYMDLIALDGKILASTRPERAGRGSDHEYSLTSMIRDHRQAVSACHDCHAAPFESEPRAEIIAFAPLDRAQWGITVRQSEDEVFGPIRLLQNRIFALMVIMIVGAVGLGYLTTRSVIVPVQELTAATRRIAQGDLESPVRARGHDEVTVLALSFNEMRLRLKRSTEEIQALNRELDGRVQERTAAYQAAAHDNALLYAELQRKEQLRGELLHRVISAQEDERMRIARELHDETSQGLTALMVGLDTVHIALEQDPQKANAHLRGLKVIAETLLKNIHRLISDLRPSLLDDLGLVPAIAWYGEQRLKPLGINFQLYENGLKSRLTPSIETALFRIVQEAMTNIVRHARATSVTVRLVREHDRVSLQVTDNGQGFDPALLQIPDSKGKGLGLRGMQERVTTLGGEFQLQSSSGTGTTITIGLKVPEGKSPNDDNSSTLG